MNNTEFKKIVGETLKSQGFAYENKYYTFENTDLKVFIGFQKSNFENSFYINYGFLIKGIYDGKLPLYKKVWKTLVVDLFIRIEITII